MKKAFPVIAAIFAIGLGLYMACTLVLPTVIQKSWLDDMDKAQAEWKSKEGKPNVSHAYSEKFAAKLKKAKLWSRLSALAVFCAVMRPWNKNESCPSCNCSICGRWRLLLWIVACFALVECVEFILFA